MNDEDRVRLAVAGASRMIGPVERQRCAQHPKRWVAYRWTWHHDAGITGGDITVVRPCVACNEEAE